jgi:hypothetical protein
MNGVFLIFLTVSTVVSAKISRMITNINNSIFSYYNTSKAVPLQGYTIIVAQVDDFVKTGDLNV